MSNPRCNLALGADRNSELREQLRFGSVLSIFSSAVPGYVGGEGFGNPGLNVIQSQLDFSAVEDSSSMSLQNFHERLFEVVPAQQYVAAAALTAYYKEHPEMVEVNERSLMELRLRESEKLERRLNEENEKTAAGKVIVYGQVVQLMHLHSCKYVSVRPRLLADTEKDAMKIEFVKLGSSDSHFQIVSKYKHVVKEIKAVKALTTSKA